MNLVLTKTIKSIWHNTMFLFASNKNSDVSQSHQSTYHAAITLNIDWVKLKLTLFGIEFHWKLGQIDEQQVKLHLLMTTNSTKHAKTAQFECVLCLIHLHLRTIITRSEWWSWLCRSKHLHSAWTQTDGDFYSRFNDFIFELCWCLSGLHCWPRTKNSFCGNGLS